MNALARIKAFDAERDDPAFAILGEIAAVLSEKGALSGRLDRTLALMRRLGLADGAVAALEGAFLRGLDGCSAESPRQGVTQRLTNFLRQGEAGVLRHDRTQTIGAPIRIRDEIAGLIAARVEGRPPGDDDFRLLAIIANLLGPALALDAGAEESASSAGVAPDPRRIVGDSPALRAALEQARRVAPSQLPVLLRGESGSGKELFAQFIHEHSPRRKKAFIKVNCAALPETMLESELFGHERGAYTGADSLHKGRFERADGGTILLDEIGDISLPFQAKLLRVVQEGEFERVGGSQTLKVDVRVIAATHCDLEQDVRDRAFRCDLYYRLAVATVAVPNLRQRRDDIPALAAHILARFNAENGRVLNLDPRTERLLRRCAFPGNVRELENCLRGAAAMCRGDAIRESDLACRQGRCFSPQLRRARIAHAQPA
jgi:Nif-specific regulatory protein